MAIWVSIITASILITLGSIIIFLRYTDQKKHIFKSGLFFCKVDINNRKIFIYKNKTNFYFLKQFNAHEKTGVWVSLDLFLAKAENEKVRNTLRRMFVNMQSGAEEQEEMLRIAYKKNKGINDIVISMYSIEDSTDIALTFKWNIKKREKAKKERIQKPVNKQDIANINFTYKSFIAFQLNIDDKDIIKEFLEQLDKIINLKKKYYFFTQNMLVIVDKHNKPTPLLEKTKKITNKLIKKGGIIGFNRLYLGTSYHVAKDVDSPKRINNVLDLLSFNINLSFRKNKPFIHSNDSEFSLDEYHVFSKSIKSFDQAILTKTIKTKKVSVKNKKTNRKLLSYVFPTIDGITNEMQLIILKNKDKLNKLIDSHAEIIAIDNKIKEPIIFDITNNWLFKNYEKIVNKKAIYVINYNCNFLDNKDTSKIIEKMLENNFVFAIRLTSFNESAITFLKKNKPPFIVIDKTLVNFQGPETYIKLLTIKKILNTNKVKIIYENPTISLDDTTADILDIKYYYKFN